MIEIPHPSIVLNALNPFSDEWKSEQMTAQAKLLNPDAKKVKYTYNTPGTLYNMWKTWHVPESTPANLLLTHIAAWAKPNPPTSVQCLVINCHGNYGTPRDESGNQQGIVSTGGFGFSIGSGINYDNADLFSQIRDRVKCIIIIGCGISYVTNKRRSVGDGEALCSKIARAANAYVIAPRITQKGTHRKLPKNHIDNFEGEVVRYNRAGRIEDARLLGRKLIEEIF